MTKNKIAKISIKHNNSVNNSQTKTKLSEIVDTSLIYLNLLFKIKKVRIGFETTCPVRKYGRKPIVFQGNKIKIRPN